MQDTTLHWVKKVWKVGWIEEIWYSLPIPFSTSMISCGHIGITIFHEHTLMYIRVASLRHAPPPWSLLTSCVVPHTHWKGDLYDQHILRKWWWVTSEKRPSKTLQLPYGPLGLLAVGGASCHVTRTLTQPCGEAHVGKTWGLQSITQHQLASYVSQSMWKQPQAFQRTAALGNVFTSVS